MPAPALKTALKNPSHGPSSHLAEVRDAGTLELGAGGGCLVISGVAAETLAKGLRAALDKAKRAKSR
jgi:hypothetical protein